jgi:hypothetical protein
MKARARLRPSCRLPVAVSKRSLRRTWRHVSAHHGHGDPRHSGGGADVLGVVPQGAVIVANQAGGVGPGRVNEGVRTLSVHSGDQVLTQLNTAHLEEDRGVATLENADKHSFPQ